MIDRCEIKRILDALPWPDGKKPHLAFHVHAMNAFIINLHEPISRGWGDVAKFVGPTPEYTFALALKKYVMEKGLNGDPRFFDAIKRLRN